MKFKTIPIEQRIWQKIDIKSPNECWNWKSTKASNGYGLIWKNGANHLAHRTLYEIIYGPIPSVKLHVCHKCDNRLCCNPNHLFLGTALDNVHDMISKGREDHTKNCRGEDSGMSILTSEQVVEIRHLYNTTIHNQYELGRIFGVTNSAIWRIIHNKNWRHLLKNS
jgi:hypothetical protein